MEGVWHALILNHSEPASRPHDASVAPDNSRLTTWEQKLHQEPGLQVTLPYTQTNGEQYEITGVLFQRAGRQEPLRLVERLATAVRAAAIGGDPCFSKLPPAMPYYTVFPQRFFRKTGVIAACSALGSEQALGRILQSTLFTGPDHGAVHALTHHPMEEVDANCDDELDYCIGLECPGTAGTVLSLSEFKNPGIMDDYVFDTLDSFLSNKGEALIYIVGNSLAFKFNPTPATEDGKIISALETAFRGLHQTAAYALHMDVQWATLTNGSRYVCVNIQDNGPNVSKTFGWTRSAGRRQDGTPIATQTEEGEAASATAGTRAGTPSHTIHLIAAAFDKFERMGRRFPSPGSPTSVNPTDDLSSETDEEPPVPAPAEARYHQLLPRVARLLL